MPKNEDIDLVRQFSKTREKKKVYSAARAHLPSLLRRIHPHIYHQLMADLKKNFCADLDKRVEESLWYHQSQGQIPNMAKMIRQHNAREKEYRRERRLHEAKRTPPLPPKK